MYMTCLPIAHTVKRGWTGDSLARIGHLQPSSTCGPRGPNGSKTSCLHSPCWSQRAQFQMVPCIFDKGCPQTQTGTSAEATPVKPSGVRPGYRRRRLGLVLPLLAEYAVGITGDARLAAKSAQGAAAYVKLLHSYANDPESGLPGLLNATSINSTGWPKSTLGDWFPAKGMERVR